MKTNMDTFEKTDRDLVMTNQRSKRLLDARGSSEIGEGDGEEEVHLEEGAASTRMERRKTISPEGGGGAASSERRARLFENPRIVRRQTGNRIGKRPSATILVRIEDVTRAPARDDLPVDLVHELRWTIGPQVVVAAGNAAVSFALNGRDHQRQIESVNQADIVVIELSEVEFGNGKGRIAGAGTVQGAAAAAGLARPGAVSVESAAGATPYPATPAGGGGEDGGFAWF
ncbi:hypothetical protein U1Q18_035421 [Sarracenia purpurea var. burkii]